MKRWPFPGDGLTKRARKVALAYRSLAQQQEQRVAELQKLLAGVDSRILGWIPDPAVLQAIDDFVAEQLGDPVGDLDRRFADWGETWHAEVVAHHEPDDWVTAAEAGTLIHCSPQTLTRARMKGLIDGRYVKVAGDSNGRWYFKVAAVYEFDRTGRKGMWKKDDGTTTVVDSGRGDAE